MRLIFICLASVAILTQCGKNNHNASAEVKMLDSLLVEVENSEKAYLELPRMEIETRLDSIKSVIKFVQANYGEEISYDNGLLLDNYRGTKSIVKRFSDRTKQIEAEFERTKSQLITFKEALSSNATHDKNNEEITKEYIDKNMKLEKEAAENLISSVSELEKRGKRFLEQNEIKLKALSPYLESLK